MNAMTNRLISGTFFEIDHFSDTEGARYQADIRKLDESQWVQVVHDMHAIGIDTLVYQQCVDCRHGWDNTFSYYKSQSRPMLPWIQGDPMSAIADACDELGMKIIYGIGTMHTMDPYTHCDEVLEHARITASELLGLYGSRPSFAGWYWTFEYPPSSVAGLQSLKKIVPAIRQLSPCDFMIAPNIDRLMVPYILQEIDVDIVAYQDNVGVGVEPDVFGRHSRANRFESLEQLQCLYKFVKFAHDGWQEADQENIDHWNCYFRDRGRTALWNDLEIWEFDHREALHPTELSRVVAQLERTAPFVDKQIIYQYPGLMHHPDHPAHVGGERASTLYEGYALYRESVLNGKR